MILPIPTGARTSLDRPPVATYSIILCNVVIFLFTLATGYLDEITVNFGFEMGAFNVLWPVRLVVSMFLHAGWLHLIANMIFLWVFGAPLEDRLGTALYLLIYFSGGVAGALLEGVITPDMPMVGASACVFALLTAHMVIHPLMEMRILLIICLPFPFVSSGHVSSLVFVVLYFIYQWILASLGPDSPTAHFAHLGGAIAGIGMALPIRFTILAALDKRQKEKIGKLLADAAPAKREANEDAADANRHAIIQALCINDRKAALERYRQFKANFPGKTLNPPDQYRLAELARTEGDPVEAIEILKPLANHPKDVALREDAAILIADLFERDLRDYDRAYRTFALILKRFPESARRDEVERRLRNLRTLLGMR